jgi:hypothetical protein
LSCCHNFILNSAIDGHFMSTRNPFWISSSVLAVP